MKYIDEKFKEVNPTITIEKIKGLLQNVGVEVEERWKDSGLDNCWSLNVYANGGVPSANGKGVSEDFARASAYGEFIERLQGGLFLYKYQDIGRVPEMYIQNYAPDVKYMTMAELIENGEWMDYLIEEYGGTITRESLAKFCKLYGYTDEERIATLPFYSLFEDKYVYLPIGFVDQVYCTNGCCAGNTKEEAWVHALSEIMERRAALKMLVSGESAPRIPEEVLERYPVVRNILKQIRDNGKFDIQIFDFSIGNGFPVVSTRIIDKESHSYRVNVAADPVLEIAIQRTLTEMFQGKSIKQFPTMNKGRILSKLSDFPMSSNVMNQLEAGNGVYVADFFAEEITCKRKATDFAENNDKTNDELLSYMLNLYRSIGKPVYVRNFSYLGFPSYRFVIPGFSETRAVELQDILPKAIGIEVSKTLKDVEAADDDALSLFMMHSKMVSTIYSRYFSFGRLSGIPMVGMTNEFLISITRSYAAYRLKSYEEATKQLSIVINNGALDEDVRKYFACVAKYISFKMSGVAEEKIRVILYKFFEEKYAARLYEKLDQGLSPYEGYLLKCNPEKCDVCRYRNDCKYHECKEMNIRVGQEYKKFVEGQNREEFIINK